MPLKFLVDANLSWRVCNLLRELGHDAEHVFAETGLTGDDRNIWQRAEANKAVVFTRDLDFLQLWSEDSPAKLLLYRGRNAKRSKLLQELKEKLPSAIQQLQAGAQKVVIS